MYIIWEYFNLGKKGKLVGILFGKGVWFSFLFEKVRVNNDFLPEFLLGISLYMMNFN